MLARLSELPVRPLKLFEEAGVLDGDDRLIRERLQQRDMLVAEP